MSTLTVFSDDNADAPLSHSDSAEQIAESLRAIGVNFEQWQAEGNVVPGDSQEEILQAYRADVDRLVAEAGYQAVDVVSLSPDHPDKSAMRSKFLAEHTHSEDEVRFFVAGEGLFTLHVDDRVYEVLCRQGDLIGVPADTRHWFDMGPNPNFVAIRFFNNPEGWVANFTGSDIAERFSRLEN